MKTIINQIGSRCIGIILFFNFLFICVTNNVFAQAPTVHAYTINTNPNPVYVHDLPAATGDFELRICAPGDLVTLYFSDNAGPCTWTSLTSSNSNTTFLPSFSSPAYNTTYTGYPQTNELITATFYCNTATYIITVNIVIATCPYFRGVAQYPAWVNWNWVDCNATYLNTDCDLFMHETDRSQFEIIPNGTTCPYVKFTFSSANLCSNTGWLDVHNYNWPYTCNSNVPPGDYTVTATFSSSSASATAVPCCHDCGDLTIDVHVGACPSLLAENLTNGCNYPNGFNCEISQSPCTMDVRVGDIVKFSALPGWSACQAVQYSSINITGFPCSSSPCNIYAQPWQYTFSSIGTYTVTATFSGASSATCTVAGGTCNTGNDVAEIIVNVNGVFDDASVSSVATVSSPGNCNLNIDGVLNTGNDRRIFNLYNSTSQDVFEVNVWDAALAPSTDRPGFGWHVNYNSTDYYGCLPLNSAHDAQDPDVCLVKGYYNCGCCMSANPFTTVYAIVIYYSATEGVVWRRFYWDINAYTFNECTFDANYHPQLSTATSYYTNIDSDDNENFVMVWKEGASNPRVYCNSGVAGTANTTPYVNCWNTSTSSYVNKLVAVNATMPDVSIFHSGATEKVRIVYTPTANSTSPTAYLDGINLDEVNFSSIGSNCSGNSITMTPVFSADNLTTYGPNGSQTYSRCINPRIATPNSNGTQYQYCVVFENFYDNSGVYSYNISAFVSSDQSTFGPNAPCCIPSTCSLTAAQRQLAFLFFTRTRMVRFWLLLLLFLTRIF